MLDYLGHPQHLSQGCSRRAILRLGGLSPLGLSLSQLLASSPPPDISRGGSFGKAKRCLLIYLWGGPSHLDLFDLKSDAPSEVRGPFRPIRTSVPGIQIGEVLPNLAKQMHRIGLIRSVSHSDNNHSTSAHWMLTGHKHPLAAENFGARRTDFPHLGSVITRYSPAKQDLPTFVALPERIGTTAGFVTPGQDGGFLGGKYDPFRIEGKPNEDDFSVKDLQPVPGLTRDRLTNRKNLLDEFDRFRRHLDESPEYADQEAFRQRAFELVTSPRVREAFDLGAESLSMRESYDMRPFGQSLLMARRLLESGVKLVTVYWHRDQPGVDTTWDTHSNNFNGLRDRLAPQVDRPISTLLEDLAARGLLDDTLVVWSSEFGRTPKVNKNAGRDHWGKCNSLWMAGAGVPGGQAYGASDKIGSEPVSDAVSPGDFAATIYHLLGLDPHRTMITDRLNRSFPIADGRVLNRFLGA
ncbi:MAG: DUF1501 domain-containing protein [Verrucomicrobiales bacterium]|nr:DUF1501 domain-containing protein [Akkermansiaceae bacterium]HRX54679.1 DUF1501 domain-containing protein [Verrucomicrobiales bacterium]